MSSGTRPGPHWRTDNFAQNVGYINPPRIKRQFRDPHADWWDKQERRNFGEPVHEDHDILGMFSPYEYTWISAGKGLFQIGVFVAVFLSVCLGVKLTYPDRPSYPREFDGGLERELGGKGAIRASQTSVCRVDESLTEQSRPGWRATRSHKYDGKALCIYEEKPESTMPTTKPIPFVIRMVWVEFIRLAASSWSCLAPRQGLPKSVDEFRRCVAALAAAGLP